MGDITTDQLFAVFGDLRSIQESQERAIGKIERLVSEKFTTVTSHIVAIKNAIDVMLQQSKQQDMDQVADQVKTNTTVISDGQEQQLTATKKLDQTLSNSFKALSTAFLTKESKTYFDEKPEQKIKKVEEQKEPLPTKIEKLSYEQLISLNGKIETLISEVKDPKDKKDSGLMRMLSPFLLLFGGIAALSYGVMKFPYARRMLEDLKKGTIGQTLSGLINKIKPQEKSIQEWLRGLPFIGRFFDIYDAFKQFSTGNIKQGLKHLMFAIPGAEFIIDIIGSSKKEFLSPGGASRAYQGMSLQKIGNTIMEKVNNLISPITTFFKKIYSSFELMSDGTWGGIQSGLDALKNYFPILTPVVSFLQNMTDNVFESAFADEVRSGKMGTESFGQTTLGEVINVAIKSIYTGITTFFNNIGKIFSSVGNFVSAIGDVFSGDYAKQSRGLNAIDEFSPGIGSVLRTAMNLADTMQDLGISDDDSLTQKFFKLTKGIKYKGSTKYSRPMTYQTEAEQLQMEAVLDAVTPEERDEKLKQSQVRRSQGAMFDYKAEEAELKESLDTTRASVTNVFKRGLEGVINTVLYGAPWRSLETQEEMPTALGILGRTALSPLIAPASFTYGAGKGAYEAITDSSRKARERERLTEVTENITDLEQNIASLQGVTESVATSLRPVEPSQIREIKESKDEDKEFSIFKTTIQQQNTQLLNHLKYLPEMYLLFERLAPDISAIKQSNEFMRNNPSPLNVLTHGGTTMNFGGRSSDSGPTRGALMSNTSLSYTP